MKLLKYIIIFSFCSATNGYCQSSANDYTLENIIEIAKSESIANKISVAHHQRNIAQYNSYKKLFLPEISFTSKILDYSKDYFSVIQPSGTISFQSRSQNYSTLGLAITQIVPQTGGTVSVSSNLTRFDDFILKEKQYNGIPINLSIRQPINAYNEYKWLNIIEPIRLENTKRRSVAELAQISLLTTKLYFNVIEGKSSFDLSEEAYKTFQRLLNEEKEKVKFGTTSLNKYSQIEIQMLDAEKLRNAALEDLNNSIVELSDYIGIHISKDNELRLPSQLPEIKIDNIDLVSSMEKNMAEYTEFKIKALEAQRDLEKVKKEKYKINVGLSVGYNSTDNHLGNVYSRANPRQSATLSLNFPILDWGRLKETAKAAEYNLKEVELAIESDKKIILQNMRRAVNGIEYSIKDIEISRKMLEIAKQRYSLLIDQFSTGKITVTDLINSQQENNVANQSYIRSLRKYWENYYELTVFVK
ncbi:TolC family protein [Sphingobacterium sp. DR205]|uniref:TolC family protein n=1 Tax=Sphingobacterium sp. DR205 TaxID=2713573 RepID=UPI0013E4FEA6|nr:TolC family protein [Sphingobacterium sp. DR205]QIH35987.1 TolC family protein [Sphingobacterium sp. DR205]